MDWFRQNPELGPRLLFFTGGSALRAASRRLAAYTQNSIHVVTPFDSGGSSAPLRQAFGMPAVGDIRNRLMALADPDVEGNDALVSLFAHRLPRTACQERLQAMLDELVQAGHPKIQVLHPAVREVVRRHLQIFRHSIPPGFDLAGACIGNAILCAGCLEQHGDINAAISLYSGLAAVRGIVRPVVRDSCHLGAVLADGQTVIGQHLLTGKQAAQIPSPIRRLFLTSGLDSSTPCFVSADRDLTDLIGQAELICYPMGSFFTSVLANLLPRGVAESIARARCPKVFVPNTFYDPEALGLTLADQVRTLLSFFPARSGGEGGLDFVLLDGCLEHYPGPIDLSAVRSLGVRVARAGLVTPGSAPGIDPERLVQALFSLASSPD
jgi:CofD-related protein of GAK system